MSLDSRPTTALEAVNVMLGTIGQSPIDSLPSEGGSTSFVDAVTAEQILHETSRRVQTEGWEFNTDYEYSIAPNVSDEIIVPSNTLKIVPDNCYRYLRGRLTQRAGKIWDRKEHTYEIGETYTYSITFFIPFDELPESARYYFTVKAARVFQDRMLGSDTLHRYSENDEAEARALLMEANDNEAENPNFLDDDAESGRPITGRII